MAEIIKTIFELDVQTGEGEKNTRSLIAAVDKLKQSEKETGKTSEELKRTQASLDKVLSQETKTIAGLEAKQRLLRETLKTATIGSNDFNNIQKKLIVTETQLARATGKLTTETKQLDKSQGNMMNTLKRGVAAIGIAFGAQQLIQFAKESVLAFAELELATKKLEQALIAVSGTSEGLEELKKQAEDLSKVGIFDDDVTLQAQAAAAQFGLTGEKIKSIIPIVEDFAAATGQELGGAMDTVLKGTEGITRGLKIYGINISDTGDKAKNLNTIMGELNDKFRGQNEIIAATTTSGRLAILANQWDNFKESIGAGLVDVIEGAKFAINNLNDELFNLGKLLGLKSGQSKGLKDNIERQTVGMFNDLITEYKKTAAEWKKAGRNIDDLDIAFLELAKRRGEALQKTMKGVNANIGFDLQQRMSDFIEAGDKQSKQEAADAKDQIERAKQNKDILKQLDVKDLEIRLAALKNFADENVKITADEVKKTKALRGLDFDNLTPGGANKQATAIEKEIELRKKAGEERKKLIEDEKKLIADLEKKTAELNVQAIKDDRDRALAEVKNKRKQTETEQGLEVQRVLNSGVSSAKRTEIETKFTAFKVANDQSASDAVVRINKEADDKILKSKQDLHDKLIALDIKLIQNEEQQAEAQVAENLRLAIQELKDTELTAQERKAIVTRLQEDANNELERIGKEFLDKRRDENEQAEQDSIDFHLRSIQARMQLENISFKEKVKLIELERDILIKNTKLSENEKLLIIQEAENKIKALRQARLDNILEFADQIKSSGLQIASDLIAADNYQNDLAIKNAQNRIDSLKRIADKGNAEILQAEEERLNKLTAQRAKFVRAQSALAQIEIVANSLIAISKAAAQGGIAAIITIPLTIAALIAGLAKARALAQASGGGFAEGVIDLQGKGTGKSDSIPARLSKGESVMTAKETQTYKPTLVAMRRKAIPAPVMNEFAMNYNSSNNFSGLERRVERVENAILELPKRIRINTQSLNITEKGLTRTVTNRQEKDSKISNPDR